MSIRTTATERVGADGRAVLELGPVPPWQTWHVSGVALSATEGYPEARVYRGLESPANLLGGSYTGQLDSAQADVELEEAETLTVVFSGGVPGSEVTARAERKA